MSNTEDKTSDIPELIHDSNTKKTYERMRFFGEGGFARCYEIIDVTTKDVYAAKIVSKKLMMKPNQKEKMALEIDIHRSLDHPNIVKFNGFFEDSQNIYIVLELCEQQSMYELHKRRIHITEDECRYYMHQIMQGVKYLHDNHIIHRDLKLANLFLNVNLHVKIGDFGLATRIENEGERKYTVCGTPNYIAPEILTKGGHSYEVDVWSIGCVMYTLLVGKPPFETATLKETYSKIKKCKYRLPIFLRKAAAEMVVSMLQLHPENRPSIGALLNFAFFKNSPVPVSLPISCLTKAPQLEMQEASVEGQTQRRPLSEINGLKDDTCLETTIIKNY